MSKYQYKNDTALDLVLPGVGVVKAGEILESEIVIENPNLTTVNTKSDKKKAVNKETEDVKRA